MFAIIDIETTGGSYKYERIIEIAIVIFDGEKIVETFDTLINPEILIPLHITRLTGITNDMVRNAPKFYEIAKRIVQMTEDKIFVAHNVNFDFSFIRKEFSDLGFVFSRKKLCTVKYTRQIYPGLDSYSLGKLAVHFEIQNNARHRAMGDAMATTELLAILLKKDNHNLFKSSLRKNDALVNMHNYLDKEKIDALPESPGIYYFLDSDQQIIYIGKSVNIHQRIISHLNNDSSAKSIEMKNKIAEIKYDLSGSDLIAQLMESEKIKKHKPFYNRVLKRDGFKFGIYAGYDTRGYLNFVIKKSNNHSEAVLTFNTSQHARNFIFRMEQIYGICYAESNVNQSSNCLRYMNSACLGMCISQIDVEQYNSVFKEMLKSLLFDEKDFIIELPGRESREKGFVLIQNGKYKGYGFISEKQAMEGVTNYNQFLFGFENNYDSHLIVKSYLSQNEIVKYVV